MNPKHSNPWSHSKQMSAAGRQGAGVALSAKAEAKAANRLSRKEQWRRFGIDLAEHDSGNQPA